MGKGFKILIVGVTFFVIISLFSKNQENNIRIRVLADSDEINAQSFKIEVAEAILKIIEKNQDQSFDDRQTIKLFNQLINKEFNTNNIKVTYEKIKYPSKSYQGRIIPSGYYWTILVRIGSGKGKNWWSILYPEFFGLSLNERICFEEIEYRSYFYDVITR